MDTGTAYYFMKHVYNTSQNKNTTGCNCKKEKISGWKVRNSFFTETTTQAHNSSLLEKE